MTDYFKCPNCGKIYDEFQEKDYKFMKGMREMPQPWYWKGPRDYCYPCSIDELDRMEKRDARNIRIFALVWIIAVSITVVAIVNYVLDK